MAEMEITKVCIDTDVLIDVLRGHEPALGRVKGLEEEGATLFTTSVNVFELYYGALKSKKIEQNLGAVKKLFEILVALDFTKDAAEKAGEVLSGLETKGQTMETRDLFVGATALANGCALLTRNIGHFKRIEGLDLLPV